jgi:hypothetical protein
LDLFWPMTSSVLDLDEPVGQTVKVGLDDVRRRDTDLGKDKIGDVMGQLTTIHWDFVLGRRLPYDAECAERDQRRLEAATKAIDEQLIPLTQGQGQ